jgi:hypothetical protein
MASFTAYVPPGGDVEKTRVVSDGFSLFALLFAPVYLLWHRLWYAFALWLLATVGLAVLGHTVSEPLSAALSLLPSFFLAIHGPELVRARLERLGWQEAATVSAASAGEAEMRFFHGLAQQEPSLPRPAPALPLTGNAPRAGSPSLGIFPQ